MRAFFLQQQIEQATQVLADSKRDQYEHVTNMQKNACKTFEVGDVTIRVNNPRHGLENLLMDIVISKTESKELVTEADLRIEKDGKFSISTGRFYRGLELSLYAQILTELNAHADYVFNNF